MPSPHPVQWLRDHPRAADLMLALLVTAIAVAAHVADETSVNDPQQVDSTWWTVALVIIGTMPLYWRRSRPLVTGLVVVSFEVLALLIGMAGAAFLGSVVAVYSIGAHSSGKTRTRVMALISALIFSLFVVGWLRGLELFDEFISTGVLLVTAYVLGDNLRRRRERVESLAERAERAEREQELLAEQRVIAERTRIARELHDVVAHSVSVMVIQAAAARRNLTSSPETSAEALSAIETTGRQTMNELRGILGVLRTEGQTDAPMLDPQPSLDRVDVLVDGNDLPVELAIETPLNTLPDSVSITGYRLIQEALTNIRRHAGSVKHVDVSIARDHDQLKIMIADDGRGAAA
ncbi:MAG: hypothetical protein IZT58_11400, partial [Actinobacteria bacterium]|nr:hypothetical protein [Actinomycetota bacterium]